MQIHNRHILLLSLFYRIKERQILNLSWFVMLSTQHQDIFLFIFLLIPLRYRSNHQRCSIIKGVLRNFAKFTRKHLCQSLFFNNVAGLSTSGRLLLKTPWFFSYLYHRFSVNVPVRIIFLATILTMEYSIYGLKSFYN